MTTSDRGEFADRNAAARSISLALERERRIARGATHNYRVVRRFAYTFSRSKNRREGDSSCASESQLQLFFCSPLPRLSSGYDNNYEIVQTPGAVAIVQEMIHETRVIPLDGRPHLDGSVRQWLGDSRGHWEGNTLVVETTNFNERRGFEGATENMRLVERWTRVADDRIDYRFTVSDQATGTKP